MAQFASLAELYTEHIRGLLGAADIPHSPLFAPIVTANGRLHLGTMRRANVAEQVTFNLSQQDLYLIVY